MDILRRRLAPLVEAAWEEIDKEARDVLISNLSARHFVDVSGPKGYAYSAVNLGRLDLAASPGLGAAFGTRRVLPLVEFRVPFKVSRSELDNLARGADDVELGSVREAAHAAANFEERAVYLGLGEAGIEGIVGASEHDAIEIGDPSAMAERVAIGMLRLRDAGIDGPYALVLGPRLFAAVAGTANGYPLRQQLAKLVGRNPIYSPAIDGGLLVSTRGGDFELTIGQDFAIGFDRSDADDVWLFLLETFTFRVLERAAVAVFR